MSIDYGLIGIGGAVLALVYAVALFGFVRRQDPGTSRMVEIATAVREGADAFLNREYRVIAPFAVVIVILIYVFIDIPLGTHGATAVGFAVGAALSAIAGYIGMAVTVRTSSRTAQAAKKGLGNALNLAFR
ncbi:MAG TPA: sodium/proton-translocating pyrophosphatase, partial [Nitrososphaerales archaeon]|nr:sodium/proton-translocating pyrophosphatase [Nitrososphaerales archaeon]